MIIVIPAERYVVASGECPKAFVCEKCGTECGYVLRRRIRVFDDFLSLSFSDRAAFASIRAKAEKKMAEVLANEMDAVPCSSCGWVQSPMMEYRRTHALRWMKTLALISLLSGIALGIMFAAVGIYMQARDDDYYWFAAQVAAFGVCAAISLRVFRRILLLLTDPNRRFNRRGRQADDVETEA